MLYLTSGAEMLDYVVVVSKKETRKALLRGPRNEAEKTIFWFLHGKNLNSGKDNETKDSRQIASQMWSRVFGW
jgi:hypothetical protein